jgi:hypothetical protein
MESKEGHDKVVVYRELFSLLVLTVLPDGEGYRV